MWLQYWKNEYGITISENEELRSWFKVTNNRKKVWNIHLWLLEELKRICEKHGINYYADAGALLWAIRHKWFIPWDDDMDIAMFREDYERFLKIAPKELPNHIKLRRYYLWFYRLENLNTAALWFDNLRDEDLVWGIALDIFPMDYASKFSIINRIKSALLIFLRNILVLKKFNRSISIVTSWKKIFVPLCKFIFYKVDYLNLYNIRENIAKKVFFKWQKSYNAFCLNLFFPTCIYDKSSEVGFESTSIRIPDWYDKYLTMRYGDYMKPEIRQWWHNLHYSVSKPYKDIIKAFDKSKSNEENYKNCKDLFVLS